MAVYSVQPIGIVYNSVKEIKAPCEIKKVRSIIKLNEEFAPGLYKIENCDFIDVVFYFHKATEENLRGIVKSGEEKGVFASRMPFRPNKIGVSTVRLLEVNGLELVVDGLDCINETPVLDIKAGDSSTYFENKEEIDLVQLKKNPRREILNFIEKGRTDLLLGMAARMHGHFCPGLALGVMAGTLGLQTLKAHTDGLEDVIAITETNNCFSDGIQFVTGCSFGNNSLVFKDFGKVAYTIAKRNGKAFRISTLPDSREYMRTAHPWFSEKYKNVVGEGNRNEKDVAEFKRMGVEAAFAVLTLDYSKIFKIEEVSVKLPGYAPSRNSVICSICGESFMETKGVNENGKLICAGCSSQNHKLLDGFGIHL